MRRRQRGLFIGIIASMALVGILGIGCPEANATAGFLRSDSIVNCNGVYYGQHGDDDHWHVAQRYDDGRWHAAGDVVAPPAGCSNDTGSAPVHQAAPETPSTPATPATPTTPAAPATPETPAAPATTTQPTTTDNGATSTPESNGTESSDPESTEQKQDEAQPEASQSTEDTVFRLWLKNDSEPVVFDSNNEYYTSTKLGSAGEVHFYYEVTPDGSTVEVTQYGNLVEGLSAKLESGDNVISFKVKNASGQEQTFNLHVAKQNLFLNWVILISLFLLIMALCSFAGWTVKYFVRGSEKEKQAGLFAYIKARLARGGWRKMLFPLSEFMNDDKTKVISTGLTFYTLLWFIVMAVFLVNFNTADNPDALDSLRRDDISGKVEYVEATPSINNEASNGDQE